MNVGEVVDNYLTHSEGWVREALRKSICMTQERQACWERQPCHSESKKPAEGRDDVENEQTSEVIEVIL